MPQHRGARTDGEPVKGCRFELQNEPMAALARLVTKQAHGSVVVGYQNVDSPVVIDVAESGRTADFFNLKRRTGKAGGLTEWFPAALVVKQLLALGITRDSAAIRSRERYGAVSDEKIQPAIVVIVEPLHAETGVAERTLKQANFGSHVVELARRIPAKRSDTFAGEVSHQQHLAAVVLGIREGHAHARFG